jgi:hypothetical protein
MNQPHSDSPRQSTTPGPATLAAAIRRRQAAAAAKAAADRDAELAAGRSDDTDRSIETGDQ